MPNLHLTDTGRTHGIRATYVNGRCTEGDNGRPCTDCRRANAEYLRRYRRRQQRTIIDACNTSMAS